MQIEFLQAIATERGGFQNGQIVTLRTLPLAWQAWLTDGVIRILPDDQTEIASAPALPDRAIVPRVSRAARRRAARRTTVAD